MKKWEYKLLKKADSVEITEKEINALGILGWRIVPVNAFPGALMLEREIHESPKTET